MRGTSRLMTPFGVQTAFNLSSHKFINFMLPFGNRMHTRIFPISALHAL